MHCPQFAPSQNAIPVISCYLLSIVHLMNTYTVSGFFYTLLFQFTFISVTQYGDYFKYMKCMLFQI